MRPRRPELNRETIPIVIIGGGIAGLAAAVALGQRGHSVVVAERRRGLAETGAGLQLSPNASHILHRWGIASELALTAVAPRNLSIRRWGEPRAYADMPLLPAADGAPFWVMLRADLHGVLRRAAEALPGVRLLEGMDCESLAPEEDRQRLRFASGRAGMEMAATVVIGADGQRSRMRSALGDSRDLDPARWEAWRTLIPVAEVPAFARMHATNLWLGRSAHAVHYPVAAGALLNLVVMRRATQGEDGWDRVGDFARLADSASSAAEPLRALFSAAPAWSVWTVRDRMPALRLADGPVALVGDAAHPVLPFLAQGAAMAIEDAEVLALSLPPPDVLTAATAATALARYARARAPRVQQVFAAARSNAFAYHLPFPLSIARDLRIRSMGPDGMRERYSWLYDWRSTAGAG